MATDTECMTRSCHVSIHPREDLRKPSQEIVTPMLLVSAVFNDTGQMNLFILIPKNLFCFNLLMSHDLVFIFRSNISVASFIFGSV